MCLSTLDGTKTRMKPGRTTRINRSDEKVRKSNYYAGLCQVIGRGLSALGRVPCSSAVTLQEAHDLRTRMRGLAEQRPRTGACRPGIGDGAWRLELARERRRVRQGLDPSPERCRITGVRETDGPRSAKLSGRFARVLETRTLSFQTSNSSPETQAHAACLSTWSDLL